MEALVLQRMLHHEKSKHQDTLPKPKLSPATAQSQGSFRSSSILESVDAEAQALMRAVRQILEEKVAILRGLHTTELNSRISKPQYMGITTPMGSLATQSQGK